MPDHFEISVQHEVVIIRSLAPPPEDTEARKAWHDALSRLVVERPQRKIVFNMTNVPLTKSLSLGFMAATNQQIQEKGYRMRLCHLTEETEAALEATRLKELFDIYKTEESAIEGF